MKKKAELFTADKLIEILEDQGKEFGYKVDSDIDYDIEDTATISYLGDDDKLYLSVVVLYGGIYTKINIFDKNDQNIFSKSVRAANFDISEYKDVIDKVFQELGQNVKFLLNTPEKIYDYGEENNWQGLEQKHYDILSQDKSLAQMAVADMQDKEIVIPETLKQFRRYSMSFKEMVISKIAKEKNTAKKVASATKKLNKKAAWSDAEKKQVGALDDNAIGKYNIYQTMGGEIVVTNKKLNDKYALMDTAETFEDIKDKVEKDWEEVANAIIYDKNLLKEYEDYTGVDIEIDPDIEGDSLENYNFFDLSKDYATEKKAAEEDLDVKLKVQKNKPAGLDTSSPKSLPEGVRPLMQDLKNKMATLKETETKLANVKADLDAKYQEAKDESKIVEKQAEIENLTNNIGKLLMAAKNETFQFQDNLVALTHQTKVVPAKATDKWKFEKVFEKLKSLMGDENAQKFLEATLNGLQSQATEKTITELNIFSPTQKQLKKSDTSDTNKFIDALKEIYTNLRSYFIDVKKANNIIEEQLATGAAASKTNKMNKKALQYWDGKGSKETSEEETNEYEVSVKVVFNGTVYCKATSQDEANSIVVNNFRCLLGKCEDNLEDGSITDWDMDVHGETELDEDHVVASKTKALNKKAEVNKKAKMHKKAADNKVRIFLTNLGKYNEGELVGEWVDLPVQDFKPILDKIGIDGKNYEEVFITDYEAPFEIGEYENINALNEKVKKIEALDEEQKDILYSLADEWDFDELYEKVSNGDYMYIPQGSIKNAIGENEASDIDLAYGYIEMLGGFEGLDKKTLEDYFDYDSYGNSLSYNFQTTDKGYVEIY